MKVLYIGGAGRSGSTLLEIILGNLEQFFSVGEIRLFWGHLRSGGSRCGCGAELAECEFWSRVIRRLERAGLPDINQLARLNRQYNRTRDLPVLEARRFVPALGQSDAELVAWIERLYQAAWEESGRRVIVDSSKVPSQLYLLTRSGRIDLRVLHLVRDGRAVAYSWSKRRKPEPGIKRTGARMPARSAARAMLTWAVENAFVARLGRRLPHYTCMRYEDFVRDPRRQLEQALARLGWEGLDLGLLESERPGFHATHSVGGNPIRFSQSQLSIVADEEWRQRMPGAQQLLLGLMGLPMLRHFQYPIR